MIEKIKAIQKKVAKIKDDAMLTPQDVLALGVVVNSQLEPSVFTFYRLIKRGQLKVVRLGGEERGRYLVKGSDLKAFLTDRYSAKEFVVTPVEKPITKKVKSK